MRWSANRASGAANTPLRQPMSTTAGLLLMSGLAVGAVYAMAAVGLVLLYRTTGVLNLGQGAIGAVAAMLAWQLSTPGPVGLGAALPALAAATALSLLYGQAVAPRLAGQDAALQAVGTLGLALVLLGAAGWAWPQSPRRLLLPTDALALPVLGLRLTGTRLLALAVALLAAAGVALLLGASRIGLAMRAMADHRAHALLLGLPVRRAERLAWALSGLLCGLAGLLLGSLVRLDATVLTFLVIPALAAALVGRLQSLRLTLAAGLAIGVVEALLALWPPVVPFRAATPFVLALLAVGWRLLPPGWPRRGAAHG